MDESEKWRKRYERERKARAEAEALLEGKSLALYTKTQELDRLVAEQKELIAKRTRDLASASEEARLLSDAVSHTENGVIITGPDNKVIWANQAVTKISGYRPDELIGKVPGKVLQGESSDEAVREYMHRKITKREPFEAEILNYHKEGYPYWVHLHATPVLNEAGKFKYFVAIQSDITQDRETREKLKQEMSRANTMAERAKEANAAKTKFLATMSHELRTPLNGIIGYTQILERNRELKEKDLNQIQIIRRSGEHLLSLINDLLDISKIEAGSHHLVPSRFDLSGMLKSVIEIVSSKAHGKGLQLKLLYNTGENLPKHRRVRLFADSRAIRQILINLLGNAIKYTERGSVILEVDLQEFDGEAATVRFAVIDTGRGIPENKLTSLFDAFEQVDAERDVVQGSGLGLFIAQRLVQEMGDQIRVESTVSAGSCFSFQIVCPMDLIEETSPQVRARVADEQDAFPVGYDGPRQKILIVDDVRENRVFLIDLLGPTGFEFEEAQNGRQALKMIQSEHYDLILSDIIMPFMSGYELIKNIRSDPKLRHLCVVAVSASLMQLSALEKAEMKNFDGFISKPIQVKELLSMLQEKLKLNWVYPAKDKENLSEISDTTIQETHGKSDLLARLQFLARIGDIKALRTEIKPLEERHPELSKKLLPLIRNYKAQQAAEILRLFIEEKR